MNTEQKPNIVADARQRSSKESRYKMLIDRKTERSNPSCVVHHTTPHHTTIMRKHLLLAMLGSVAGCSDATTPQASTDVTPQVVQAALQAADADSSSLPPPEAALWNLSAADPDFAGMYRDSIGNLVLLSTRGAQDVRLKPALASLIHNGRSPWRTLQEAGQVEQAALLPAAVSVRDLLRWKGAIARIAEGQDIRGIGILARRNRLRIDVADTTTIERLRVAADALGIPSHAIEFASPIVQPLQSVQAGTFTPMIGGINYGIGQITQLPHCTIWGFARVEDDEWYGLTNSHCLTPKGTVTGVNIAQPFTKTSPPWDGQEWIDPAWNVAQRHPDCINGVARCRYSDAAAFFVSNWRTRERGRIARTTGSVQWGYGSLQSVAPSFQVTGIIDFPIDGEVVNKVGARTGWTRGPVEGSCYDVGFVDSDGFFYRVLCNIRVVASAYYGDSGSPVFFDTGPSTARVTGILWGGEFCRGPGFNQNRADFVGCNQLPPGFVWNTTYPSQAFYMNPWWAVRQELGFSDASVLP